MVNNQIDELARVAVFMEETGDDWNFPMSLVLNLNLVLEEALTNIILYGFEGDARHTIEVHLKKTGDDLSIEIIDDGKAFDPTNVADPDITLSVENRAVGGLGIFLIRKIMDTVEYKRIANKNNLILKKNIKP